MASPFLEVLKRDIRLRGYSIHTEKTYLYYIRFYINLVVKRKPDKAGSPEVKALLSHLTSDRNLAINVASRGEKTLPKRFCFGILLAGLVILPLNYPRIPIHSQPETDQHLLLNGVLHHQ